MKQRTGKNYRTAPPRVNGQTSGVEIFYFAFYTGRGEEGRKIKARLEQIIKEAGYTNTSAFMRAIADGEIQIVQGNITPDWSLHEPNNSRAKRQKQPLVYVDGLSMGPGNMGRLRRLRLQATAKRMGWTIGGILRQIGQDKLSLIPKEQSLP